MHSLMEERRSMLCNKVLSKIEGHDDMKRERLHSFLVLVD